MATIGSLTVNLTANTAQFQASMKKSATATERAGSRMRRSMKRTQAATKSLTKSMAGYAAGMLGVAAAGAKFREAFSSADFIQKTALRLQMSVEALSQYKHVMDLAGVSFENFIKGQRSLQKATADAMDGLSTQKRAFDELGISAEKFSKIHPDRQFLVLAEALNKVENPTRRTQLAMALMGRAGSEMLSAINEGAGGLKKAIERVKRLNLTLTQADANAIAKFNDSMTELSAVTLVFFQRTAAVISPWAESFVSSMVEISKKTREARLALVDFYDLIGADTHAKFFSTEVEGLGLDIRELERQRQEILDEVRNAQAALAMNGGGAMRNFYQQTIEESKSALTQIEVQIANLRVRIDRLKEQKKGSGAGGGESSRNDVFTLNSPSQKIKADLLDYLNTQSRLKEKMADLIRTKRLDVEETKQLIAAYNRGPTAVESLTRALEIEHEAMRQNIDLSSKQGQAWLAAARDSQAMREAFEKIKEETETVNAAFTSMTDQLIDQLARGELSWRSFASSAVSSLQDIVSEWIKSQAKMNSASSAGGGILKSLFGAVLGGLFGGVAPTTRTVDWNNIVPTTPGRHHSGGIVGTRSGAQVAGMVFANAPRMHSGGMVGLAANEVPIIGKRGEEVLTENDPRHRTT